MVGFLRNLWRNLSRSLSRWVFIAAGFVVIYVVYSASMSQMLDNGGLSQLQDGPEGLGNATAAGAGPPSPDRPLVLYAFFETDTGKQNLEYFLRHGLDEDADYVFILNGPTTVDDLIPHRPNIQLVRRENACLDLGSFGEVLQQNDLWRRYKRFITLNCSIRGPFIPIWSKQRWTDLFLERITDKVKLVGTTFNCNPRPHVQSMLWATDSIGMSIMLDGNIVGESVDYKTGYSMCYTTKNQAIAGEVGTTSLIISRGYSVDVLEAAFHSVPDFVTDCQKNSHEDPNFDGKYFGISIHPYDVVFIKANRDINPLALQRYTEWHDNMLGVQAVQTSQAV